MRRLPPALLAALSGLALAHGGHGPHQDAQAGVPLLELLPSLIPLAIGAAVALLAFAPPRRPAARKGR